MATEEETEKEFQVKAKLYTASESALKTAIEENGVVVKDPKDVETRVKTIKFLEVWLEQQKQEADGGKIALLGLEQSLTDEPAKELPMSASDSKGNNDDTNMAKGDNSKYAKSHAQQYYRKELKIYGQIDNVKGLAFVSLIRQIESAVKKGYPSFDIVDSVIRAVPVGTGLRNYLEGRPELSLPSLRHILRAHYKEKSATELFHQLGQLTQGLKEEPTDFLIRALELRQKVLFASPEEQSDLKYDEKLVNRMFCHTLYTGLSNDVIRHEFKSHLELEGETFDDEHLIVHMSQISMKEEERSSKFGKSKQSKQYVNAVESNQVLEEEKSRKPQKTVAQGKLNTELNELKERVATLNEMVCNMRQKTNMQPDMYQHNRGHAKPQCKQCESKQIPNCNHCFYCGSEDHFARGCRLRYSKGNTRQQVNPQLNTPPQENYRGLLNRDRQ